MPPTATTIRLAKHDAAGAWGEELENESNRAFELVRQRLGVGISGSVYVRSFRDEMALYDYLGATPEHVVAVARPQLREILVVRPLWTTTHPAERHKILVHEATHMVLGNLAPERLPRWLDEGMAMITAQERNFRYGWRVAVAGALGGLLPLAELQHDYRFNGPTQELAYAESLAVTRFYLNMALHDQPNPGGDPGPLARALADPERGRIVLRRLWDAQYIQALDRGWRQTETGLWSWVAMLTGGSVLWFFTSMLFLLAWWRKQRFARQKRERFEYEEAMDAELGTGPTPWDYGAGEDYDDEP